MYRLQRQAETGGNLFVRQAREVVQHNHLAAPYRANPQPLAARGRWDVVRGWPSGQPAYPPKRGDHGATAPSGRATRLAIVQIHGANRSARSAVAPVHGTRSQTPPGPRPQPGADRPARNTPPPRPPRSAGDRVRRSSPRRRFAPLRPVRRRSDVIHSYSKRLFIDRAAHSIESRKAENVREIIGRPDGILRRRYPQT